MDDMEFMNMQELQEYLHLGRNKAYALVNQDDFPKVRIGKTFLIPKHKVNEWVNRNLYKTYELD